MIRNLIANSRWGEFGGSVFMCYNALVLEPTEDEGVILGRQDYRDFDRIITAITKEHGVLAFLAKGVRKAGSKNAPGVDLMTHSRLEFIGAHHLRTLIRANPLDDVVISPAALDVMAAARLLGEVVETTSPVQQPNPALYEALLVTLEFLAKSQSLAETETVLCQGLMSFSRIIGFAPELNVCHDCEKPVVKAAVFDLNVGAISHPSCSGYSPWNRKLTPDMLETLRAIVRQEPISANAAMTPVRRLLVAHLAHQTEHVFTSEEMLDDFTMAF